MTAYYNENDPYAAQWLRNLIKAGHIAPGRVDERSIRDVVASDLSGYTQCHFFAGIGIWSAALRQAGWPDDRPVWTGSCPCQPFSAAGKGVGAGDDRHLWPVWFELIRERRPVAIFGEQVASKDGLAWLDIVQTDLETAAYASGAVDLCSAGLGAPNIRQRLWWLAYTDGRDASAEGLQRSRQHGQQPEDGRARERLADSDRAASERRARSIPGEEAAVDGARQRVDGRLADGPGYGREAGGVADAAIAGRGIQPQRPAGEDRRPATEPGRLRDAGGMGDASGARLALGSVAADGRGPLWRQGDAAATSGDQGPGPVNGFWAGADWLACTDGKSRPVEAGTFPLVAGDKGRVGKLRAYGNAINQEVAAAFIGACMSIVR